MESIDLWEFDWKEMRIGFLRGLIFYQNFSFIVIKKKRWYTLWNSKAVFSPEGHGMRYALWVYFMEQRKISF